MTARNIGVGVTVAALLACSGLMGYGEEIADAQVRSGQPFKLVVEPKTGEPHQLWMDYDVSHSSPYKVTGTIELQNRSGTKKTWTVQLTDSGSPIVGGGGRKTINSRSVNISGEGSASATIHLVELPPLPAGEPARISGTLTAGSGTTLKSARIIVTD